MCNLNSVGLAEEISMLLKTSGKNKNFLIIG